MDKNYGKEVQQSAKIGTKITRLRNQKMKEKKVMRLINWDNGKKGQDFYELFEKKRRTKNRMTKLRFR